MLVHRDPVSELGYRQTSTYRPGEELIARSVKDLRVDVAVLFP
jgi:hypothetical protein